MFRLMLVAVVWIATFVSIQADPLIQSGVGGGGFLQAGAFDPTDTNTVLIGGDNSGVYRSDDYGDTWYLWNEGLTNPDEAESDHVEDLLGISWDDDQYQGYFAATRAGVFFRNTSHDWEWQTGGNLSNDIYNYTKGTTGLFPLPFSCLDFDGVDQVFAGAGYGRFLAGDADISDNALIWYADLSGADPGDFDEWLNPPLNAGEESIRDLSVAHVGDYFFLTVATPGGVFLYTDDGNGTEWIEIDTSRTCWSVHLTDRGTLYAAFAGVSGQKRAVWRLADVEADLATPTTWDWESVDTPCAGNECGPPPGCRSVSEIGRLALMTVHEDTASGVETIYLTGKPTDAERGGLFRCELDGTAALDTNLAWKHWIYADDLTGERWHDYYYAKDDSVDLDSCPDYVGTNGSAAELDFGYHIEFDLMSLLRPVVSPTHPRKVVMQGQGRLHKYSASGDEWEQVFTKIDGTAGDPDPTDCTDPTFWETNGYNQQAVRDLAVRKPSGGGQNVLSMTADYGLFRSKSSNRDAFERLNPSLDGTGSVNTFRGRHVQYEQTLDATYVVYGGQNNPGQVFQHTQSCGFEEVTSAAHTTIDVDADKIRYEDIALADSATIYIAYTGYDQVVDGDQTEADVEERGVIKGTYSSSTWSWTKINSGLDPDAVGENPHAFDLLYNPDRGFVLMACSWKKSVGGSNLTVPGGLFYLDHDGAGTTWTRVIGDGDTTPASNLVNFLSLAQSSGDGEVLYAGTGGRQGYRGAVIKCDAGSGGDSASHWSDMSGSEPFGFSIPLFKDATRGCASGCWDAATANIRLTEVYALAVNPYDDDVVFAGLNTSSGTYSQEGVWSYDLYGSGEWEKFPGSTDTELVGVGALAFYGTGGIARTILIGTSGHDLYRATVFKNKPREVAIKTETATPFVFRVLANRPNPFNPVTILSFELPGKSRVLVEIFSVSGQRVRTLTDVSLEPGHHKMAWDGTSDKGKAQASGIYFSKVSTAFGSKTHKMVLMR